MANPSTHAPSWRSTYDNGDTVQVTWPRTTWCRIRLTRTVRCKRRLVFPLLVLVLAVTVGRGDASKKIQLLPLGQHVESAVAQKLQSILPTLSARFWVQLQIVKRELKSDMRNMMLLLEEHAGVSKPQAVGDTPVRTVVVPTESSSPEVQNPDTSAWKVFERNVTEAVTRLEKLLSAGLESLTEGCVREIEENSQTVFDQQRSIIRSLEQITKRLEELGSGTITPTKALPFLPSSQVLDPPRDCREAQKRDIPAPDGITVILPLQDTPSKPRRVRCDQRTAGGGWTVALHRQRQPQQLNFRRDWRDYEEGFGDPHGEYWIGLRALHELTSSGSHQLRVMVTIGDEKALSVYSNFSVGPSTTSGRGYRLQVSGFQANESTAGDSLAYHDGRPFTTYDADNDAAPGGSCSLWCGGGGWWYNYCFYANPTAVFPPVGLPRTTEGDVYLEWRTWQGYYAYLSSFTMMIRPH